VGTDLSGCSFDVSISKTVYIKQRKTMYDDLYHVQTGFRYTPISKVNGRTSEMTVGYIKWVAKGELLTNDTSSPVEEIEVE
jgi:hypothetical protein